MGEVIDLMATACLRLEDTLAAMKRGQLQHADVSLRDAQALLASARAVVREAA